MLDNVPDDTDDERAYRDGYARAIRELGWAQQYGWVLTERQIVLAITQTMKVYSAVRGGKFVSGRHPEWLHGRADALRAALRGDSLGPDDPR